MWICVVIAVTLPPTRPCSHNYIAIVATPTECGTIAREKKKEKNALAAAEALALNAHHFASLQNSFGAVQ